VPGTLRDSLSLLSVVLEQQTELQPTEIMSDTGAYTDTIFGIFHLLGYQFSPRLADIGGTRFWRVDGKADYSALDAWPANVSTPRSSSSTGRTCCAWPAPSSSARSRPPG
jgi:TnpA family transposase